MSISHAALMQQLLLLIFSLQQKIVLYRNIHWFWGADIEEVVNQFDLCSTTLVRKRPKEKEFESSKIRS